jgi:CHAD domain-containing protein
MQSDYSVDSCFELKVETKSSYALSTGTAVRSVHAQKIKLGPDTSIAAAFQIIGNSILRQVTTNEPSVRASNPEGIHQMRIGLRRLRVAISVFAKMLSGQQTNRINKEIKWLTGELGPARDLDVFMNAEARRLCGAKIQSEKFSDELAARRAFAFTQAIDAVDSVRYRSLILDAQQWITAGAWIKRAPDDQRVKRFAENILTRRTKKAKKKCDKLPELNVHQRHKLRIAIKKLRYSSEFFESLFVCQRMKKHLSSFKNCLKALQDRLGALNDIAVQEGLTSEFRTGKAHTVAFDAESNREPTKGKPPLKTAAKAVREFRHVQPFWT